MENTKTSKGAWTMCEQEKDYVAFNYGELYLPVQALLECNHQGRCDPDVALWVDKIGWEGQTMDADAIRKELREYGAWDDEELSDDAENRKRILWITAGNWQDEQADKEEEEGEEG